MRCIYLETKALNPIVVAKDDFLFHCRYEKNLTDKTLRAYAIDLTQFLSFLQREAALVEPADIDRTALRAYLKLLAELHKPKTVKRKVATLRAWFNFLEFEDRITVSPFRKMNVKITLEQRLPVTLTLVEMGALFDCLYRYMDPDAPLTAGQRKTLIRDIAVIELLFATGMRVSELCGLDQTGVDLASGAVHIWGKGRRERVAPLTDQRVLAALARYGRAYAEEMALAEPFFFNRRQGRLTEQSVRLLVAKHVDEAGIRKKVTPHTFRHTLATLLLEQGVDIRYIQSLLGHSAITTTQLYVKVNQESQRRILEARHPRLRL